MGHLFLWRIKPCDNAGLPKKGTIFPIAPHDRPNSIRMCPHAGLNIEMAFKDGSPQTSSEEDEYVYVNRRAKKSEWGVGESASTDRAWTGQVAKRMGELNETPLLIRRNKIMLNISFTPNACNGDNARKLTTLGARGWGESLDTHPHSHPNRQAIVRNNMGPLLEYSWLPRYRILRRTCDRYRL